MGQAKSASLPSHWSKSALLCHKDTAQETQNIFCLSLCLYGIVTALVSMDWSPLTPQAGPVHGQFDAGARFTARSPPSIPPPPPGVAPTPAQLAAMRGQQVVMGQKEGGVMNVSGS